MKRALMAICILVALTLPRFIYGRPAIDNNGSMLSMSVTRASKPEDLLDYERKAILHSDSTLVEENASFPIKSRQKRLSDQRRAELETLMTLSRITGKRSLMIMAEGNGTLDPIKIGRRRRFTLDQIPIKLLPIHHIDKQKLDGDPAYPLIS
ncbi:uncharacterized protein [Linepithema humile]|uniref:uncharacterized protein n=1 Tax=Linepithema humile TaxID=83485 RepID=UPI00351DF035